MEEVKTEQKKSPVKILITGGHATSAYSMIDELLGRDYKTEDFLWVGEKYNQKGTRNPSGEYNTVTTKYKIHFIDLMAGKLIRKWTLETFIYGIFELFTLFLGFIQSFFVILKYRPKIIVSFGGFLAVPIVFWGKIFGAKIITHEQTLVVGLANKMIAKFADKILISFKESEKFFPKAKTVFTGNPIRKDVFEIRSNITAALDPMLPLVYITGGNQGANEINKRVFEFIPHLLEIANVVHQTGSSTVTKDHEKALEVKSNLHHAIAKRYIVKDYVGPDEIGEVLNKSAVLLSRSGANIVLEILALGKLSVLIPIPWASHDEQNRNAKLVEETGLGISLKQTDELKADEVYAAIIKALEAWEKDAGLNGKSLEECRNAARSMVVFDAATKVADEVVKLI